MCVPLREHYSISKNSSNITSKGRQVYDESMDGTVVCSEMALTVMHIYSELTKASHGA